MASDDPGGPVRFDGDMFELELGVMRDDLVKALASVGAAGMRYMSTWSEMQIGREALDTIKELEHHGAELARHAERLRLHMFGNDR